MKNIDNLKKKILYRSEHRGTKEMDLLLSNFVKKYIDSLNVSELRDLESLLNIDDDVLYKWYLKNEETNMISENSITKKLKEFKLQHYGGEGGIRTHEGVAPLLVFKTSAFNRSATSPDTKL